MIHDILVSVSLAKLSSFRPVLLVPIIDKLYFCNVLYLLQSPWLLNAVHSSHENDRASIFEASLLQEPSKERRTDLECRDDIIDF